MPWYWTDDLARIMVAQGLISDKTAVHLASSPIALRRDESSIEEAVSAMAEDDEIPLAA